MSDYTPTGKPQTLSPQVSKQMRDEFQSIADAVNSKSDVDGDTYTGVHDFTGATLEVPTQPTPDNSNKAASTSFVHQVLDSAVPSQAGHAGKTLITDGINTSWGHDATKANKAGDTYTGTHNFVSATSVRVPTAPPSTSSTTVANTAFVQAELGPKANKAGDTYTGVHNFSTATIVRVPTVTPATTSTTIAASTAFVHTVVDSAVPDQTGHAGKTLVTDGTNTSWGHDATRADKAGDTYTGAHNFTGATVTVPTAALTSSTTSVASTAFVRSQPNWEVIDVNDVTSFISSNRRGEIYVCGPAVTDLNLPAPTSRFYVRAHNPNAGVVAIHAGGSRTINGGPSVALLPGRSVTITRDGSTSNYRAFFFNVGSGTGTGTPYDTYQDFLTSGTFTVQKTGLHRITAIGAGGSGGRRAGGSSDPDVRYVAGGGGAGGTCVKEVMLTQGINYTVTIGAGGASLSSNATGNAGGTTTVIGTGVSMTANGGGGGASNGTTGSTSALSVLGGVGGNAAGGDVNHTGGDGGQAQVLAGSGKAAAAGGGGAPNIFGTRPAGGEAIASPLVGGDPNDAASGGGASAGGGGYPSTLGGAPAGSVTPTSSDDSFRDDIGYSSADWRVGYPVRGNTPTIGDGRGYGSGGTIDNTPSGNAQAFAGSGGASRTSGLGVTSSGAAGLGGGSGGTAGIVPSAGSAGAGGDGFVIFEWVS